MEIVNVKELTLAVYAYSNLYNEWEQHGGPSPDTRDEQRVIAEALGVNPILDDTELNKIWDSGQDFPANATRESEMVRTCIMHLELLQNGG